MAIKYGILLIYSASPISRGEWITSSVILNADGKLETESQINNETFKKVYFLSPDWFIVTPRNSFNKAIPPLPENKHPEQLFALTQRPDTTIWFLGNSKYERNQWIEHILPFITLKLPTPEDRPPPYFEYDNCSYSLWQEPTTVKNSQVTQQNSFHYSQSFTSLHRSGFYSVQTPAKKSVSADLVPVISEPKASEDVKVTPEESTDQKHCCYWCSLSCAWFCKVLGTCMHQCCSNFTLTI